MAHEQPSARELRRYAEALLDLSLEVLQERQRLRQQGAALRAHLEELRQQRLRYLGPTQPPRQAAGTH